MSLILIVFAWLASSVARAHPLSPAETARAMSMLPRAYVNFMAADQRNDYAPSDSEVSPEYRPGSMRPFRVRYIEIPRERVDVELAPGYDQLVNSHILVQRDGREFVRFTIHPDSEELYRPLIREFGFRGFYYALASSSTRTVLAWDPVRPQVKPVFLKLSLARLQDDLGRIVPAWEIRRSVRVTMAADQDRRSGHAPRETAVIPEFAGVSIRSSEGIQFHIDNDQGRVSEHGLLARDASFIENHPGKLIVPYLWLFTHQGLQKPPIIQLWERSGLPFDSFLRQYLFSPVARRVLPLMVRNGIVPQIHAQNMILVLDPQTWQIEFVEHRDAGSMKTDYRLRAINGLGIEALRSRQADKDFGLSWGAEKIHEYWRTYFFDWPFHHAYGEMIRRYVAGFNLDATRAVLDREVQERVMEMLDIHQRNLSTSDLIALHLNSPLPPRMRESVPISMTPEQVRTYVQERVQLNQSVQLPTEWRLELRGNEDLRTRGYLATEYGIVYSSRSLGIGTGPSLLIAFYDERAVTRPAAATITPGIVQSRAQRPRSQSNEHVCRDLFRAG